MSSETTAHQFRVTTTLLIGTCVVITVGLVLGWALGWWSSRVLGAALQVLGIALTALAVAEFRSRLELITTKAIHRATETKNEMRRRVASRRERVELWWLARRGRTRTAYIKQALGSVRVSASGTVTTSGHPSIDRATISDRDWLAFLNDQVDALRNDLRAAEKRHSQELTERLAAQRDRLRTEIRDATREGSGLVLAGLLWLAAGTVVGVL